jgi:hypothetical protein
MQKKPPLCPDITQVSSIGGVEGMFHYGPKLGIVISNMAKTSHVNAENINPHTGKLV